MLFLRAALDTIIRAFPRSVKRKTDLEVPLCKLLFMAYECRFCQEGDSSSCVTVRCEDSRPYGRSAPPRSAEARAGTSRHPLFAHVTGFWPLSGNRRAKWGPPRRAGDRSGPRLSRPLHQDLPDPRGRAGADPASESVEAPLTGPGGVSVRAGARAIGREGRCGSWRPRRGSGSTTSP